MDSSNDPYNNASDTVNIDITSYKRYTNMSIRPQATTSSPPGPPISLISLYNISSRDRH